MDCGELAEHLIAVDTSTADGVERGVDMIGQWLRDRGVSVEEHRVRNGLPSLIARRGVGPTRVALCGHADVVPGEPMQFRPRRAGNRLVGRGAYDMKAALAAMMIATVEMPEHADVQAILVVVPDEERTDLVRSGDLSPENSTHTLVARGLLEADIAILGEPTDLHVGIEAKGVLMLRVQLSGRGAHGSTPWEGDNAILKAHEAFRTIQGLPFAQHSSETFSSPSVNLARIQGGDVLNRVPDQCWIDVDIRYLPGQDPTEIVTQIHRATGAAARILLHQEPVGVAAAHRLVAPLIDVARSVEPEAAGVGRHGASDAVAFTRHGIPAVEFGPTGAGHHGPEEYVDLAGLQAYEAALANFLRTAGARSDDADGPTS
jgi:succinyl-diaminopimelate desuccinylase